MRSTFGFFTATLALVLCMSIAPARADNPPAHISAADKAAFENFRLNEDFLDKYKAVEDNIAEDPCKLGMIDMLKGKTKATSLDEGAAHWDAKPGVHAMLARHDVTARQMLLGMMTLMSAAMQDLAATHPKMAAHMHSEGPKTDAANVAFYKAHQADIRQHSRARAKKMMQTHNGKLTLPSCFGGDKH